MRKKKQSWDKEFRQRREVTECIEELYRKYGDPGKTIQEHHWIEQSRIRNREKYPFLSSPPMEEDLLKSKSNLSLIVGHNGGHKKTYNDLLDEQLFDIVYKLEEKYGVDYMLKSNNLDFIKYVNNEVEKLIMTLKGDVMLNNVIMNNAKLMILD